METGLTENKRRAKVQIPDIEASLAAVKLLKVRACVRLRMLCVRERTQEKRCLAEEGVAGGES